MARGLRVSMLSRGGHSASRDPASWLPQQGLSPSLRNSSKCRQPPASLSDDFASFFGENKCFQMRSPHLAPANAAGARTCKFSFCSVTMEEAPSSAYEEDALGQGCGSTFLVTPDKHLLCPLDFKLSLC